MSMFRMTIWVVVFGSATMGFGATAHCRGADTVFEAILNFFTPRGAEPAVDADEDWVPLEGENQYTPLLKKLLGSELYYVRKVCGADDAQIEEFRRLGLTKVQQLAGQYAKMQNRQSTEWPDARILITDAFITKVAEVFPEETARKYADEVKARRAAQADAALSMMITIADRKLMLTAAQADKIREQTASAWDPAWSRTMQVYMYDEYSPRPPEKVLKAVLNERQHSVFSSGQNYGRISFGWEQDLGFLPFWGDDGSVLEEVK